uniref:Transferrin n=1 Tax=Cacopsylla melanoneura TaxID=428564 RepID=A0A8D8RA50_9HEMI
MLIPLLILFLFIGYSHQSTYKICATEKVASTHTCQLLQKGNSQVECVRVVDSVDCALKLSSGDVDFGVFNAEEALVASKFINQDVSVIGQVKHRSKLSEPFAFQSVAVVRQNFTGEFDELRGKKYCHPGFNTNQYWTDRVLKEFERRVVPHACTSWVPQVRVEMFSLAEFFGNSCRPGPWASEQTFDEKLKKDFASMCQLCDNPHPTVCSYNSHDSGTHKEALDCLTQKDADVTYVALNYVQEYFGLNTIHKSSEELPSIPTAAAFHTDYKFLCPNKTVQPLDISEPCAWVRQPWNVVVARKSNDIASTLRDLLPQWLPDIQFRRDTISWQSVLYRIIQRQDIQYTFVPAARPLNSLVEYIGRGREIPTSPEIDPCRRPISWCTISPLEQQKCLWLQYAVLTHGIAPNLRCIQAPSKADCLRMIHEDQVDIVGIDSDLGYLARQPIYNASALLYQDSSSSGNYKTIAVVKDGQSLVKNFKSLQGKKACFSQYQSLAWISFLNVTKSLKLLPRRCGYAKAAGSFLSGACLPGLKTFNQTEPENLCYACKADECYGQGIPGNSYTGDYGALLCLSSGAGDVAFINYKNLLDSEGSLSLHKDFVNTFRVMCRNGSLSQSPGFDVDDACLLSAGVGGEIVTKKSRWNRDATQLLLKIDDCFGAFLNNDEGVLHVYEKFQNTGNLLFQSTTVSLLLPEDENYDSVNSYKALLKLETCSQAAAILSVHHTVLFVVLLLVTVRQIIL